MSRKKKSKVKQVAVLKGSELLANSAGKQGKHQSEVRSGTGVHKSKKNYNRKGKQNQRLKHSLKDYGMNQPYCFA